MTNAQLLRFCAACGIVFVNVLFLGFIVAGFLPLPSGNDTAAEVAAFYREDQDRRIAGFILVMVGAGFTIPLFAAVSQELRRIPNAGPLPGMQFAGGALGVLGVTIPAFCWIAAAYFPDRSPDVTQGLHQLGLLMIVMNLPPIFVQCAAIAGAILRDPSPDPRFPRWVGWFNVWCLVTFVPGTFAAFFTHGAMAWNGFVVFWIPAVLFGIWFFVMGWSLVRISRLPESRTPPDPRPGGVPA